MAEATKAKTEQKKGPSIPKWIKQSANVLSQQNLSAQDVQTLCDAQRKVTHWLADINFYLNAKQQKGIRLLSTVGKPVTKTTIKKIKFRKTAKAKTGAKTSTVSTAQ